MKLISLLSKRRASVHVVCVDCRSRFYGADEASAVDKLRRHHDDHDDSAHS